MFNGWIIQGVYSKNEINEECLGCYQLSRRVDVLEIDEATNEKEIDRLEAELEDKDSEIAEFVKEVERLNTDLEDLQNEMSYMTPPDELPDLEDFLKLVTEIHNYGNHKEKYKLIEKITNCADWEQLTTTK